MLNKEICLRCYLHTLLDGRSEPMPANTLRFFKEEVFEKTWTKDKIVHCCATKMPELIQEAPPEGCFFVLEHSLS